MYQIERTNKINKDINYKEIDEEQISYTNILIANK